MTPKGLIYTAVLCSILLTEARADSAEILLPGLTRPAVAGEWEGAWRDDIAGRVLVFLLDIATDERQSAIYIIHGPESHFVEVYRLDTLEVASGHLELHAKGSGDVAGDILTATATGRASKAEGYMDISLRKKTHTGEELKFDIRLMKLRGGFFRTVGRLLDRARVAKGRATR